VMRGLQTKDKKIKLTTRHRYGKQKGRERKFPTHAGRNISKRFRESNVIKMK